MVSIKRFRKVNIALVWVLLLVTATLLAGLLQSEGAARNGFDDARIAEYEDRTGALSEQAVLLLDRGGQFKPTGTQFGGGQTKSTWWLRLEGLPLLSGQQKYLLVGNPLIRNAELYVVFQGTMRRIGLSGWSADSSNPYMYPVFKIPADAPAHAVYYLKLQSPYLLAFDIHWMSDSELMSYLGRTAVLVWGCTGAILALCFYNLGVWLYLRERIYLLYSVYLILMLSYQLLFNGVLPMAAPFLTFLWPHVVAVGSLAFSALFIYVRRFLATARDYPKSDKVLLALIFSSVFFALAEFLGHFQMANLMSLTALLIGVPISLVLSFDAYRKNARRARFFLLGWLFMTMGIVVFILRGFGLLPSVFWVREGLFLTTAVESLCFSLALGDRLQAALNDRQQAEVEALRSETARSLAETAALRAQIRPHFLYNAMNAIAALCRMNPEKARMLTLDLSDYLRQSVNGRGLTEEGPLIDELGFVNTYVRIEQARFGDRLVVENRVENEVGRRIPPLTLQPLVENAILHGIRKKKGAGTVRIEAEREASGWRYHVRDNGSGFSPEALVRFRTSQEQASGGIGLSNIDRRLRALYGTGLEIESDESGTQVSFHVPHRRRSDESAVD